MPGSPFSLSQVSEIHLKDIAPILDDPVEKRLLRVCIESETNDDGLLSHTVEERHLKQNPNLMRLDQARMHHV